MKAYTFDGKMGEKVIEMEIPASHQADADKWHAALVEKAAEQDDALMDKFFEMEHFQKMKSSKVFERGLSQIWYIHLCVDQLL